MLCTAYGFVPDTVAFFRYRPSFRIHQTLRLKSIEALDYFFLPPPPHASYPLTAMTTALAR